jgi:hypothetical protein
MRFGSYLSAVLEQIAAAGHKLLHECSIQEGRYGYRAIAHGSRTSEQVVPVASVRDAFVTGGTGSR